MEIDKNDPKWLKDLKQSYKIIDITHEIGKGKYIINTDEFGIVDFFIKANKVLIRKDNDWIHPGLSWIVDNLINNPHE